MPSDARRLVRSVLTAAGPLACASCLLVVLAGSADAQQPARSSAAPGADVDARRALAAVSTRSEPSVRQTSAVFRPSAARRSREDASRSLLEDVFLSLTSRRSPATVADLGSLGEVLPDQLCRDLLRLRGRVRDARRVLFGQRGIVRLGQLDTAGEKARMRLNLQYSPDPGIRFTLVTP